MAESHWPPAGEANERIESGEPAPGINADVRTTKRDELRYGTDDEGDEPTSERTTGDRPLPNS